MIVSIKYDSNNQLLEILQKGDFDNRHAEYKFVAQYDKSKKLIEEIEEIEYMRNYTFAPEDSDEKNPIKGKFEKNGKIEYVYDEKGNLIEKIYYNLYDNDFSESYREELDKNGNVKNNNALKYDKNGELLLDGHTFKCAFDPKGNWIQKASFEFVYGDNLFVILERAIEYY